MKSLLKHWNRDNIYFGLISLIIVVAALFAGRFLYQSIHQDEITSLETRARTLAELISPSDINGLSLSDSDLSNPTYQTLKKHLVDIRTFYSDTRFVYLVKSVNGNLYFIADSEDPSSPDYSPPGQEYGEASETFKNVFVTGQPALEGPLRDRWGNWISVFAPIKDTTGATVAVVGIDIDATAHERDLTDAITITILLALLLLVILTALFITRRRERELINLRADFLALASHQLRSPLARMRWRLSSIKSENNIPESALVKITDVDKTLIRLIGMVNSIIETTATSHKVVEGQSESKADLSVAMTHSVADVSDQAADKHINFVMSPTFDSPHMIKGETERLELVFTNLLSNAAKYSPDHASVEIDLKETAAAYEISVSDHGMGIPERDIRYIFEGFYRAHNARNSGVRGSGFGLYMSKKIVEFAGGMIKCSSVVGKGTTFIVTLPKPKN